MMMNKIIIFGIVMSITITAMFIVSDNFAVAKQQSKIQFTKTISSSEDPGINHDGQFALLLSPNKNSLYTGSLTFTANEPVEILILHEITKEESKGQPIWSVDGNSIYGLSIIEAKNSGSLEFTGAALGFRAKTPFTVTVSLDGWIRGQLTDVTVQKYEIKQQEFFLQDSHLPVTIPMHEGFFDEGQIYYIITDSSNKTLAEKITDKQDWNVKFSPKLRWAPMSAQDVIYVFTNGIKGDGIFGFQTEVFPTTPLQDSYTPLRFVSEVSWKTGQKPQVFNSVEDILKAEKESRIKILKTNVTINAPQIVWPTGEILVKNTTITNSFDDFQVLEINKNSKKVTFVAHRAWGPDGSTIYYIIPDTVPKGPADLMGVPTSERLGKIASSSALSDMYQFKNGIKGSGQLGFQANVLTTILNEGYVPICRVYIVEWKDPTNSIILETVSDISSRRSDRSIYVTLARPLSEDHIINCPIIESPRSNKG